MAAGALIALPWLAGADSIESALSTHPIVPATGAATALPVVMGPITATRGSYGAGTAGGYLLRDWQPDYLDRIIITLSSPNFGTVAGVVERTLTIWNRYRTTKSVTAQGAVGADSIAIVGWPAMPFDLLASEERTWPLQATADGEPVIAGYLTFTVGGEDLRTADLSGIRAIIFPHAPNWDSPPEVSRGYADSVDEAISQAEERASYGDIALVDMRYSVLALDPDEASALARTLERTRSLPVGMPLWTEARTLTAAAPAGSSALAVTSTVARKFSTARPFVLLWQDWRTWAIAEVSAVAAGSLTLTAPLLGDWPAGTQVVPVRFGQLALDRSQPLVTDRVREFDVDWEERVV